MILVDKTRPRLADGTRFDARTGQRLQVTHGFPRFYCSPEHWEARTVYIIRRVYIVRHVSLHFSTHSLTTLNRRTSPTRSTPQMEYVTYCVLLNPSSAVQHHLSPTPPIFPRCRPQMKGPAPVTLNEPEVASHLLFRLPFDRDGARPLTNSRREIGGAPPYAHQRALGYAEYRKSILLRTAASWFTDPAVLSETKTRMTLPMS
ncbi:hypothetical protein H4582DRAFT_7014 [Lactarius indigo]|nr:hypothetical protein H4582DRAFT_7014 [Lactarius indigo]